MIRNAGQTRKGPVYWQSTPPAVFLWLTIVLATPVAVACGTLYLFADRIGNDPDLLARLRFLTAVTAITSVIVVLLAIVFRRWLE
jgi:hypothetical protein